MPNENHPQLDLANKLAERLARLNAKLATAESCTGGGIAYLLTEIPGSSTWFDRGWVTYSNDAKQASLGVPQKLIEQHGAVSEQVVAAMAEGALLNSNAQWSIATSGIAGPTGGSQSKPVGTVCFAIANTNNKTLTLVHHFNGDRRTVREKAISRAIEFLLEQLP